MVRKTFGAIVVTSLMLVTACVRAPDLPSVRTPPPSSIPSAPTALPLPAPTGSPPQATSAPAEIPPVDGTVLPIAARNGAPGLISCGAIGPFAFKEIGGPRGAEMLVGPEYDVLRQTIAQYGRRDDAEFATLAHATYTVVLRDATTVEFLGDIDRPEAVYASVTAAFDGTRWNWAGMDGACIPVGAPGNRWTGALWDIDPSFKAPTAATRTLHLLVREIDCAVDSPVAGRLSPAWVFLEKDRVRIQAFVRHVEPLGSCDGIDPTPVTVVLPEPLGPRDLKDVTNHEICRGCGG